MQVVALNPAELFEAVKTLLGRRKKIVIMAAKGGKFAVADAQYRAVAAEMPCTGDWTGTAEVNGIQLRDMLKTLADKELILISKEDQYVVIKGGTSTVNLKRADPLDQKKTKRKQLPHKGKVEHAPAPETKRAEYGDTWGFSARVPLPAEAYKKRPTDWDKE